MTKLKNPLLSLSASGRLTRILSFKKQSKVSIVERTPVIDDVKSPGQLAWRHMYQKCSALWHTLSAAEKADWESLARSKHMTGFAYWQSQCLKPNPGIYLPLQGGTMQGNIDMDKHRVLKLPLPTDAQEAASKKYHDDNLPVGGYTQGARVYNSNSIALAHEATTALTFDSQRYDTDSIHSTVANTSRLTCRTAGIYAIKASVRFGVSAVGYRAVLLRVNGSFWTAEHVHEMVTALPAFMTIAIDYSLAVNDYVELLAQQTSGDVLNVDHADYYSPEFMMQRIG